MPVKVPVKGFRMIPARDLVPCPVNWRRHEDQQSEAMKGLLAEIGFVGAVIAWERPDGKLEIIDGHLRQGLMGEEPVPVVIFDVDEATARKALATHDPIAALAGTDKGMVAELQRIIGDKAGPITRAIMEASAGGLNLAASLRLASAPKVDPDEVPEPPKKGKAITKPGDLWKLGDHRLLCGDSTKARDVRRLMGKERAGLMNTDPPYGVRYDVQDNYDAANATDGTRRKSTYADIENDALSGEQLQAFLEAVIRTAVRHLAERVAFYLWHPMLTQGTFFAAAAADILIHRQIIWVKDHMIFGRGDYHWKHELCFYGWRKGHRPVFYGPRNQDTVWAIGQPRGKEHPTQKPVELFTRPALNHTREGDVCYEPFAGSGPQFIAAEQLDRRCFGMEIEPRYCDVVVARWEKFTGRKADRCARTT